MPPIAKKSEPKSEQIQIHIRLSEEDVELLDKHAAEMQAAMRKVSPLVTVSRVEATQAIIKRALRK